MSRRTRGSESISTVHATRARVVDFGPPTASAALNHFASQLADIHGWARRDSGYANVQLTRPTRIGVWPRICRKLSRCLDARLARL